MKSEDLFLQAKLIISLIFFLQNCYIIKYYMEMSINVEMGVDQYISIEMMSLNIIMLLHFVQRRYKFTQF